MTNASKSKNKKEPLLGKEVYFIDSIINMLL